MSLRARMRPYLPDSLYSLPLDLAVVLSLLTVTAVVVSFPVIRASPVRAIVSFPFLLFCPGYAFVSVLFPQAANKSIQRGPLPQSGLSALERVFYGIATSVAIVPLLAFGLSFTPIGFRLLPMLVAVSSFTVICVAVAVQRRASLPVDQRYTVPDRDWVSLIGHSVFPHDSQIDRALNVAFAVVLVFALTSVGYAFVDQQNGESYSELYLLTQTDDGTFVADDYPSTLAESESHSLVVGVSNQENERIQYSVVITLQQVQSGEVTASQRLDAYSVTLEDGETDRQARELEPSLTGERLRLTAMLFRGDAPPQPTNERAYRSTYLWVNVTTPPQ